MPTVALVGYTNAGKTTLFNVLTRADAEASNALFVTLDPLVRQVRLPDSRELLVSDTVGFIDRLPHALVAAFRATLEEVADADLVLHVIDAAAPDRERRMAAVRSVLEEVGAIDVPLRRGLQQVRPLTPDERRRLQDQRSVGAVHLGARRGRASTSWSRPSTSRLALDVRRVTLTFDPDDPRRSRADRPASTGTRRSCSTRRATARSRSSPTCRAGCSRGSVMREPVKRFGEHRHGRDSALYRSW